MKQPRFIALTPFLIFLCTFTALNIFFANQTDIVKDNFPLFSAVIAIIFSFFTFQKNHSLNQKLDIFIKGSSQPIILHMCYIFLFSTVFTHVLDQIGAISSAVKIGLFFIPSWCILPGIFIISSLFSLVVGTSMGAIAAFMPIGINIAQHLQIDISLITATIICGAMFGDNLSVLSDTTIAAVKVTRSTMKEKFLLNLKIGLPAFFATLIVLSYKNYCLYSALPLGEYATISLLDIFKVIPYVLAFYLAIIGLDILAVLIICTIFAVGIGIWQNSFTLIDSVNIVFDGFYQSKGMVNVFILVLLLAGLSKIISYNGGINYLLKVLSRKVITKHHGRIAQLLLISLVNITIAINTISILVTGPIATKIGDDYDIKEEETATILDIGSCITQGILPYTPQLLLAASMAQVSTLSLLPYLYYQYFLAISLLITLSLLKK